MTEASEAVRALHAGPPQTPLVSSLPATVPFVGPEALERRTGRPLVLRLGANESSFGPSPRAVAAMRAAAGEVHYYGDPENYDLRVALAALHGVTSDQVTVGSGADDLLGLVVRIFLAPGEVAVNSLGGYPTFNYHVVGYGGRLQFVPYRDDHNDLDALVEAATREHARLLYLANPDNPSGTWQSAADIAALIERLPDGCLLVLDEAYADFAPAEALPPFDASDPRVLRVRTFSKAHGLAGARVGYAIGERTTIQAFEKVRLHFGVNRVAQAGALASLADPGFLAQVVAEVARGRQEYATLAAELGLASIPSTTNFVAVDVGGRERARALLAALAERDVFVRMPGAPPLDRCIRVTVGKAPERAAFAEALRAVWPAVASAIPAE